MNRYEKRKENEITAIMKRYNVTREEAEEIRLEEYRELGRAGGKKGGRPFKYSRELAREANKLSHIKRAENKRGKSI